MLESLSNNVLLESLAQKCPQLIYWQVQPMVFLYPCELLKFCAEMWFPLIYFCRKRRHPQLLYGSDHLKKWQLALRSRKSKNKLSLSVCKPDGFLNNSGLLSVALSSNHRHKFLICQLVMVSCVSLVALLSSPPLLHHLCSFHLNFFHSGDKGYS